MTETTKRRQLIRRIVTNQPIATQADIVTALHDYDVRSTQASVSRDIAAIGLVKAGGYYAVAKKPVVSTSLQKSLTGRIHRVKKSGDSCIVLHTDPGNANIVALSLDRTRWSTLAGTIAGDDTVFVACSEKAGQKEILDSLKELVPEAFL
jgi:transcriptional regulator of arginine metabolism